MHAFKCERLWNAVGETIPELPGRSESLAERLALTIPFSRFSMRRFRDGNLEGWEGLELLRLAVVVETFRASERSGEDWQDSRCHACKPGEQRQKASSARAALTQPVVTRLL